MNRKNWLAIAAMALAVSASPAIASRVPDIIAGTYILYENGNPSCTAQAVSVDGQVNLLTAGHCTTDKKAVYSVHTIVFDADKFDKKVTESIFYADVVRRDEEADVSVLRPVLQNSGLSVVDLATPDDIKKLIKGVDVLVAGYPGSTASPMGELVLTDGYYTGISASWVPEIKTPMYRTSASIYYGNSGGGLYMLVDGELKLVGITSQTDPEMRWSNSLFATYDSITKALRLAPKPATDH